MSSRFMYSCKAFRRASISAMSAAWWSELYSVRAGMGVAKSNYLYGGGNYSVLCSGSVIHGKQALFGTKNE